MASDETKSGKPGAERLRNIGEESSPKRANNRNVSFVLLLVCVFSAVYYFTLSDEVRFYFEKLAGRSAP